MLLNTCRLSDNMHVKKVLNHKTCGCGVCYRNRPRFRVYLLYLTTSYFWPGRLQQPTIHNEETEINSYTVNEHVISEPAPRALWCSLDVGPQVLFVFQPMAAHWISFSFSSLPYSTPSQRVTL